MMIGLFGDVVLDSAEVLEFGHTYGADFTEHSAYGVKPTLQASGETLTEINLTLTLHIETGDVTARFDTLQDIRAKQQAAQLNVGSRYFGWCVITSMVVTDKWLDDHGDVISQSIALSLKEYVGDITPTPSTPAIIDSVTPVATQLQKPSSLVNPTADTSPALRQSLLMAVAQQAIAMQATTNASDALASMTALTDANAVANSASSISNTLSTAMRAAQTASDALITVSQVYTGLQAAVGFIQSSKDELHAAKEALQPPITLANMQDKIVMAQGKAGNAVNLLGVASNPMAVVVSRMTVRGVI